MIDALDGPYMIDNDSAKWEEHQANSAFQQSHLGFAAPMISKAQTTPYQRYTTSFILFILIVDIIMKASGMVMTKINVAVRASPVSRCRDSPNFGGAKTKPPRN